MGTYRVRNSGTGLGPLAATDSTGKLAPPVARTVPHRMCNRLSRNASNFGKKSPPQDFPRKIPQTQIKHTREKALCVVMLRTKIVSLPHSLTRALVLLLRDVFALLLARAAGERFCVHKAVERARGECRRVLIGK